MIEQEPVTNDHSQSNQTEDEFTPWHDYFGGLFKESLIPLDLEVESNYAIGKGPPRVDLLIIRKENTNWTESQLKYLPDGVRQSKRRHIIMELKKTQSISIRSVWQSMGYLNSYLNLKEIEPDEVQVFIISAKTPQKQTLNKLDFVKSSLSGVYQSTSKLAKRLSLICANDLAKTPYNMWIKLFASKQKEKSVALELLFSTHYQSLSNEMKIIIFNVINYWNQTGEYNMEKLKKDLSKKRYLQPNQGMLEFITSFFPASDVLKQYRPEDRLMDLKPEERLMGLRPEERLIGLKPEERLKGLDKKTIEAYLKMMEHS
jgi:hypothetical protein